MFIFERDRVQAEEGQTEGDTESKSGFRLWAVSTEPDVGLKLMNHKIMTWAEVRCLTDWATQAALYQEFLQFALVIYTFGYLVNWCPVVRRCVYKGLVAPSRCYFQKVYNLPLQMT